MIAAVYSRKSTESAEGVTRQIELSRDFIKARGWTVGPSFSDDGVSGAEFDRPGLNALMAEVARKPRAFDALVTMDSSRLGRDMAETLALQLRITRAGVRVFFYQDGSELTLDTPTQKLVASVNNFGAEDYRHQIQLKTRAALRAKAKQGHATGARTYAYRIVRVDGHAEREVVPEQAATVVRIFELAASGEGDRRIANQLNAERVPAAGPKGWSKDGVRRVLDNELYIGVAVYGKQDDPIRTELPELRVVTDDLWQRVHARKATTKAHYLRNSAGQLLSKPESALVAKYVMSGIGRCYACGAGLKAFHSARDIARYYCAERARRGTAVCSNSRGIPVEILDDAVRDVLRAMLAEDPAKLADLIEEEDARVRAEQPADPVDRRAAALAEAVKVEAEIGRLVGAIARGVAEDDVATAIAERKARVAELRATPAPRKFDKAKFLKMFSAARRLDFMLRENDPHQTRACLRKLGLTRIVVKPTEDGKDWVFDETADLDRYLTMGAPGERGG